MEEILRDNIASCLKARGLNVSDLQRLSGVAQSTLQGIMAAKGAARINTVDAIAKGLGVETGVLLGASEAMAAREKELEDRLSLLSLIPRLDGEQVADFLAMVKTELGIDDSNPSSAVPKDFKKD